MRFDRNALEQLKVETDAELVRLRGWARQESIEKSAASAETVAASSEGLVRRSSIRLSAAAFGCEGQPWPQPARRHWAWPQND